MSMQILSDIRLICNSQLLENATTAFQNPMAE